MAIPFRFRISMRTSGMEEICEGEIPDDDWARLIAFRDCARELETAEWVKNGLDADYNVTSRESGEPLVEVPNRPTDAAVRELLLLLRPFILEKEFTFYLRVLGILRRYVQHPALAALFEQQKRFFLTGHFGLFGKISVGGPHADPFSDDMLVLNDSDTFDLWLNAFVYHRDSEKRAALMAHFGKEDDEFILASLRALIADKAYAVLWLANFVDQMANSPTVLASRKVSDPVA
jgi:hypothetical protein